MPLIKFYFSISKYRLYIHIYNLINSQMATARKRKNIYNKGGNLKYMLYVLMYFNAERYIKQSPSYHYVFFCYWIYFSTVFFYCISLALFCVSFYISNKHHFDDHKWFPYTIIKHFYFCNFQMNVKLFNEKVWLFVILLNIIPCMFSLSFSLWPSIYASFFLMWKQYENY